MPAPVSTTPHYLVGKDFRSASPALRFGMYLSWTSSDDKNDSSIDKAWRQAAKLTPNDAACAQALDARQSAALQAMPEANALELAAESVSPFATGLGIEHPLENGFAFLSPYGLPYLPGSGVKGVIRRAAEELAHPDLFKDEDWTLPAIRHLFGDEESVEWAGTLAFWDVVPQVPQSKGLGVEVMTPHYSHYYQKREGDGEGSVTPHDSGKPNPINFLVVPPGSSFVFRVACNVDRLQRVAPELAKGDAWKTLLKKAFRHAYEWVGFGAKTAVGYGAMQPHPREIAKERKLYAQQEQARQQEQEERQRREAAETACRRREAEQERVEALSPAQRYKEQVDQALAQHAKAGHGAKNAARQELLKLANAAENEAGDWSAEDRQNAAVLVERIFETIGWYDPGRNSKQRQKQTKKRQDMVERLRSTK